MSGYDNDGYGIPPIPVHVVGEGGPGWRQIPERTDHFAPSSFSNVERLGSNRNDPMMIKTGGVISRPSGLWPVTPTAAGINQLGVAREANSIISGPPILDPENRFLVPEHYNDHRELVKAHWSHKPFNALRLRVVAPSQGPYPVVGVGAIVRVRGGAPFGGVIIEREFILTPSMEACFMAGKYANFQVDVLTMTGNTQLAWEWFNDTSGICAETTLWTEVFNTAYGVLFTVPPGAVEAFFEAPTFVGWQIWNGGAAGGAANALIAFDRNGTSVASPAGDFGVPVRGQQIIPTAPVGILDPTVNVQFRLSPI